VIRIWISRESTIPIREQLIAQLRFGILSGRLNSPERLPSVRDLARRLKIHSNTVSAAYRDLALTGWVTAKTGSGVFVRDIRASGARDGIKDLVDEWIKEGLDRGFALEALSAEFEKAAREHDAQRRPQGLLVVHSDLNLAGILAAEIQEATGHQVRCASPQDALRAPDFETCLVLTTASGVAAVSQLQSDRRMLIPLKTIEQLLTGVQRPASPILVGVVSRSESILTWASLLIAALGGSGSDVIQRNPDRPRWKNGLAACDLIVADVLAARELPKTICPTVLRLVPDSFLKEVRKLAGEMLYSKSKIGGGS
jgi:DNA-binding transcriptional regulator YhcF (GntR family)